jgi:hypothetical protein
MIDGAQIFDNNGFLHLVFIFFHITYLNQAQNVHISNALLTK